MNDISFAAPKIGVSWQRGIPTGEGELWGTLRLDAERAAAGEKMLRGFLDLAVLRHDSFASGLGLLLARKLAEYSMPAERLGEIARAAMAGDPTILAAALADLVAIRTRDPAAENYLKPFLYYKGFHALQWHRIGHWLWRDGRRELAHFLQSRVSEVFAVDIHPAVPIGSAEGSAGVKLARIVHDFSRGDIMRSLTIRHVTTYRYRQPVAFGEHRMMLRPRDSHDQRVIEASLEISPEPRSLHLVQDTFGNHVGIARFSGRSKELCFESIVRLEHSPLDPADLDLGHAARTFPADYSADEMLDLAHCIERHQPDPGNEVGRWARKFLPPSGSIGTFELLTRLSEGINHSFLYRRRDAKGIQRPVETLRLGSGSCRDFAMLMIEAARSFGLAARFASGYLAVPLDDPEEPTSSSARGSTHAWAQIYLPGTGWIDFDPTSGSVGKIGLVTVAVVRDPHHAIPLHGTFFGFLSDHLDMEVQVSVTSDTPEAIWATPRRSTCPQFGQPI